MNDIDHGLIFYSNVPKLQTLASSRFALIVWQNELVDYFTDLPSLNLVVKKFHAEYISSIPTSLRDLIAKRIKKIGIQLTNWLNRPYDGFDDNSLSNAYHPWIRFFDQLVWKTDYTIDYLKTCQNLLRSDRLSDDEKFRMACSYCLEKDIEEIWIRVQGKVDELEFLNPWLLHYWIDRMKNHPGCERISDTFDEDDFLLNMPMNRWATEYFWPHLNFETQIIIISKIISAQDPDCIKFLLLKLNDGHLVRILDEEGPFIVRTLIEIPKCQPLAIPFWNYVKNIFDEHKFFELVRWILISEVGGRECHVLNEKEKSLCEQIWFSAPERLKEYALNYFMVDNSIFSTNVRWSEGESYRSMRLLKMVISEASPEHRSQLWKENWLGFCKYAKSSDINEMLELCLEDATERSDFIRLVMMNADNIEINNYFFELLDSMKFAELDEFLKFCSTDHETFINRKQRILRSYFLNNNRSCPNSYFRQIDNFVALVDESFTNPELGRRFKKEFAMSYVCLDRLYNLYLYTEDFESIKHLVEVLLSIEQDVEEWKKEFESSCHHFLSQGQFSQFDRSRWQDFMMWYYGTEQKVRDFKQSIDAINVFDVFIEACDGKRDTRRRYKIFNRFLRWRFDSKHDIATFKNGIVSGNWGIDEYYDDVHRLLFGKRKRRDSVESNDK